MCLAFVFARLGAKLPCAGGPYAFTRAAFGPGAGFAVAWSYWVLIWAGNAAVAVAVVSALSLIVPALGSTPGLPAIAALAVIWILIAVNIRGVALAGQVQFVTTLLKLLPLVGVVLPAGVAVAARRRRRNRAQHAGAARRGRDRRRGGDHLLGLSRRRDPRPSRPTRWRMRPGSCRASR